MGITGSMTGSTPPSHTTPPYLNRSCKLYKLYGTTLHIAIFRKSPSKDAAPQVAVMHHYRSCEGVNTGFQGRGTPVLKVTTPHHIALYTVHYRTM